MHLLDAINQPRAFYCPGTKAGLSAVDRETHSRHARELEDWSGGDHSYIRF